MISVNDFRTGTTVEYENNIWQVIEFQHVKPGKGAAFVRTKLRNLRNHNIQEKTFRAGEKLKRAHIDNKKMQYLYAAGSTHTFMDVNMYRGEVLGISLPKNVELEVIETEPGLKGDTVSGGSKEATLETGLVVQVPLFINQGEKLNISTNDGSYLSRSNS